MIEEQINGFFAQLIDEAPTLAVKTEVKSEDKDRRCDIQVRHCKLDGGKMTKSRKFAVIECKIGHPDAVMRQAIQQARTWLQRDPHCHRAYAVSYPQEISRRRNLQNVITMSTKISWCEVGHQTETGRWRDTTVRQFRKYVIDRDSKSQLPVPQDLDDKQHQRGTPKQDPETSSDSDDDVAPEMNLASIDDLAHTTLLSAEIGSQVHEKPHWNTVLQSAIQLARERASPGARGRIQDVPDYRIDARTAHRQLLELHSQFGVEVRLHVAWGKNSTNGTPGTRCCLILSGSGTEPQIPTPRRYRRRRRMRNRASRPPRRNRR